jgi:hypothetical protein
MARLETALLTLAFLASASLVACHPDASEPSTAPSASAAASATPTAAAAPSSEPVAPQTHHVVQKDHRGVVPMHIGDTIAAPDDPTFAWRIDLEDKSAFGDPKACIGTDAACTASKRRWDVTLAVK